MSLRSAIAKMQEKGSLTLSTGNQREPLEAAPHKEVPPVPLVPHGKTKSEMDLSFDASQAGNDHQPANDQQIPDRLARAAERVCREIHGDDDAAVAEMLDELAQYPASSWDWLARHFETQLPEDYDNRRACRQCQNLASSGNCRAAQRGEIPTAISTWKPDQDRLRRCSWFIPVSADIDQRLGHERWPGMELIPGPGTSAP